MQPTPTLVFRGGPRAWETAPDLEHSYCMVRVMVSESVRIGVRGIVLAGTAPIRSKERRYRGGLHHDEVL